MFSSSREFAKFLSGAAVWSFICHAIMAYTKNVPTHLYGMAWSEHYNMIALAVSGIVALALIWYAWFNRNY